MNIPTHDAMGNRIPSPAEWFGVDRTMTMPEIEATCAHIESAVGGHFGDLDARLRRALGVAYQKRSELAALIRAAEHAFDSLGAHNIEAAFVKAEQK